MMSFDVSCVEETEMLHAEIDEQDPGIYDFSRTQEGWLARGGRGGVVLHRVQIHIHVQHSIDRGLMGSTAQLK